MLFNYIKIAFRNIARHKVYSTINIVGLAIGMACAILLLLFVRDELSYDKYNSKYKRIYMVQSHIRKQEKDLYSIGASFPIGGALKDEYPAIEESVRVYLSSRIYFFDQKKEPIGEDMICYADPSVFKVFDYKFIYGSPEGALDDPQSIVLSETLAKKYFGVQNPVGKTLSRNNGVDYIIKGVFKDLPANTFRRYSALISIYARNAEWNIDIDSRKSNLFFNIGSHRLTYILLSKNADINSITNDYERFRKKYITEHGEKWNEDYEPVFQPLAKVHLYSLMIGPLPIYLFFVYLGASLSLLILIIACINYINIATARASARAREIGVRKALGADRVSLIRQFLCESMTITIVGLFLTLALIELFLPSFNSQAGKELSFSVFLEPVVFAWLIVIALVVGLGAGSYPAFFLSSLQPTSTVKGNPYTGKSRGRLRKVLVVTQFSMSIILITLTILSCEWLNYLKTMDLGFNRDNIMVITQIDQKSVASLENLKKELLTNINISVAARSNHTVGDIYKMTGMIEDKNKELVEKGVDYIWVDFDFIDLMEMKLVEGRQFSMDMTTDQTEAFLVNETLVKEMGWSDSAIGKRMQFEFTGKKIDGRIIGVLKDFILVPVYKVEPMVIVPGENKAMTGDNLNYLSIKIQSGNPSDTIESIRKKWIELNSSYPFEYRFLKDIISEMFETGDKMNRTLIYFSILGNFLSCLGLFGLSSFVAESRTKEIGVRKVLGASVGGIVFKLSYDFLKLVLISCIIALPIAYYAIRKWNENFPYNNDIKWWLFVAAACIALVIAVATVSYHAVKAALTDPVKALRYE